MAARSHPVTWVLRGVVGMAIAASLASCASSSNRFVAEGIETGGPDEILSSEIRSVEASHGSAREVISDLRPAWLRMRRSASASTQPNGPSVFLDGIRFGGLDDLFRIRTTDIQNMEFMSGLDATTVYGTGYPEGIIHVYTR